MEVCPGLPAEYVRLSNAGDSVVELRGWVISDGEGSLAFTKDLRLDVGASVTIAASSALAQEYLDGTVLDYHDPALSRQGSFQLANGGDQVFLRSPGGEVADMFVYGDAETSLPWVGKPFRTIPKNSDALRMDTARISMSAWKLSVPGRTSLSPPGFSCSAGVFTAPEDAEQEVLAFVADAQRTLQICTYQYEHPVLTSLLAERCREGLAVSLLVEGEPVAGIGDASVAQLHFLEKAGANISVMLSRDGYRRYDFVHAKYIIADGDRILIMSENLVDKALAHNRGWGAVVQSEEAARFLQRVFKEDTAWSKGDILPAAQAFEAVGSFKPSPLTEEHSSLSLTPCSMRFAISPDTSLQTLTDLISGSNTRLLLEEMQADYEDMGQMGLVKVMEDAAGRGVKVQVLLDSSLDKKDGTNRRFTQSIGAGIEAMLASDDHIFTTIHNKGIISDDAVLVSSINLGSTSVGENRELGVVLHSETLADKLASVFAADWSSDTVGPTISLPWREIVIEEGSPVALDASLCRDASLPMTFAWDVNGDGLAELQGQRAQFCPKQGLHVITLTVTDAEGNTASAALAVTVKANPMLSLLPIAGAVVIVPLGILAWKRIKGRQ
jgi:phosphatidylserine/phosphatidylglycerophosphate/cardiolipin synthase-like enzyme